MLQLNPPLPVTTPKGPGQAILIRDYSGEHDDFWTVIQDWTGEIWTWNNKLVRAQKNIMMGREDITPFYESEEVALKTIPPIPQSSEVYCL